MDTSSFIIRRSLLAFLAAISLALVCWSDSAGISKSCQWAYRFDCGLCRYKSMASDSSSPDAGSPLGKERRSRDQRRASNDVHFIIGGNSECSAFEEPYPIYQAYRNRAMSTASADGPTIVYF